MSSEKFSTDDSQSVILSLISWSHGTHPTNVLISSQLMLQNAHLKFSRALFLHSSTFSNILLSKFQLFKFS